MSKQKRNKRSTSLPQTFRYLIEIKPKLFSSFPNLSYQRRSFLFGPGEHAGFGPNRNNLFSIRQIRKRYQNVLVLFPKRYRNVCPFDFDITSKNANNFVVKFFGSFCHFWFSLLTKFRIFFH